MSMNNDNEYVYVNPNMGLIDYSISFGLPTVIVSKATQLVTGRCLES